MIIVSRSYDRDTTKGGHAEAIPIAAELLPYLAQQWVALRPISSFPIRKGEC